MRLFLVASGLLIISALLFAADNPRPVPPVRDVEGVDNLRQTMRRISENVLPRSGGDQLLFRDLKNERIGIGTTAPSHVLEVAGGSIYINLSSGKLIMKSPDGTCSSCGPDNSDAWACSSIACP